MQEKSRGFFYGNLPAKNRFSAGKKQKSAPDFWEIIGDTWCKNGRESASFIFRTQTIIFAHKCTLLH